MKEAEDTELLRDILGAAHRCGRYEEAVAAAVDGAVLDGHHEANNVTGTIRYWPHRMSIRSISWNPFESSNIFKAQTGPEMGIVQQNVIEHPLFLTDDLPYPSTCHLLILNLEEAKEADLLKDVLHDASTRGLLRLTLEAAKEADLLKVVLRAASTRGLLRLTLEAANEAGLLKDVLRAASTCDLLRLTLAAAKEAGLLAQKAHFVLILACFLLIVLVRVNGRGLSRTRNAEHRKSVISQVTICSGDIEKNPGPDVILNDWLKEMYSELVRRWKGWKKKNIPWKQFRLPDPRNGGQDRDTLLDLISRPDLLTICDNHDTSDLYVDEFQLLRDNINDIKRLNLDVLDSAVKIRKILVKARELDNDVSLLPEDERRKAQRGVHGLQLQHVAFCRQGEQGAVEGQVEEEESEGDVDEDFDEDGGHDVEIREGSPLLPQPDCARGAAVAGDEANMLLSSSIEDSNSSSGNIPDALKEFLNLRFDENESIQFDESLLPGWDESTQNVPQNEARSPKRDAPSDHTPNDVMSCQRSETMEDTPEVTDDKHILQPRGPVDIQSQSQKSQSTIEPDQAPAPTPAPPPVLPTDASIHSRVDTLVQNLENVLGVRGLDSCRVNGNVRATFPLARKRSHSFDSGSNCNCRRNKMIRFT